MRKTLYILTALIMVVSMLLAACGTATPTPNYGASLTAAANDGTEIALTEDAALKAPTATPAPTEQVNFFSSDIAGVVTPIATPIEQTVFGDLVSLRYTNAFTVTESTGTTQNIPAFVTVGPDKGNDVEYYGYIYYGDQAAIYVASTSLTETETQLQLYVNAKPGVYTGYLQFHAYNADRLKKELFQRLVTVTVIAAQN